MAVASCIPHAFLARLGPKFSYLKGSFTPRPGTRQCARMRNSATSGGRNSVNVMANMRGKGAFQLCEDCLNNSEMFHPDRVGVVGETTELEAFEADLKVVLHKGTALTGLILAMALCAERADAVQSPSFPLIHLVSPWALKVEDHLMLASIDASTAQLTVNVLGPVFAALNFLFIVRIVMSWYPQITVTKFPFLIAYVPTEVVLGPTRKLIPPVGGVDVSPVIWVALMSFLTEILLGSQGLLVLLSQQQQ